MSDLFEAPLMDGLRFGEDFLDRSEEQDLINHILDLDLTPFRFQGWEGKRLTRSYGWRYDFADRSFAAVEPMPDWLLPLRDRSAHFAGLPSGDLVQALIVRYDTGAAIGWHRDRDVFDRIIGISLESPATLRLRRRTAEGFARTAIELPRRSIYLLSGEVRRDWEHSIVPAVERRLSITFRSLSEKGRRVSAHE